MSATLTLSGGLARPYVKKPANTSRNDIYTATKAERSKVVSLSIVNADSSARLVTIEWYDGTNYHVIWRESVAANDTVSVIDIPVAFKTDGEKLCVTAAAADVVTVTLFLATDTSAMGQGSAA